MAEPSTYPVPHSGAWFALMLFELNKQTEWAVAVGRRILDGGSENVWTDLQTFASHAGSVGAFLDTLKSRNRALDTAYPDRAEMVRGITGTTYDFGPMVRIRNGLAHIDERIEERWLEVASDDADAPQLLARAVGNLDDGRDRMLNWHEQDFVLSFRRRPNELAGYDSVGLREIFPALEYLQEQSARASLWVLFGMPGRTS